MLLFLGPEYAGRDHMYNFLYLLVTLKLLYPYFNIYFSLADKKKKLMGKHRGLIFQNTRMKKI